MKYAVEWQMSGEITIDTGDTDWSHEELEVGVSAALAEAGEKMSSIVEEHFDDCDVDGEGNLEHQLRRIS